MYIIAHWNGHGMRVGCMICGEGFDLGEVAYDALTEDAPHEMIGAICDACMVLSEAELRQRLRDAADALRQEAKRLDARAAEQMSTAKEGGDVAVCLRPLEGDRCLTDPYFYPTLEEASRLDLVIAVHIANSNPDHCDLLRHLPGTFRANGFALFRAPRWSPVSCC
jgi:hypothetical protein